MKHLKLFENYTTEFKLTDVPSEEIEDFAGHTGMSDDIEAVYQRIESEPTITLYRVMGIHNHWEVDYEDAGLHWTFDSSVYANASFFEDIVLPHGYDKYVVITAEVNTSEVDRLGTYDVNKQCPAELEITLREGAKYKITDKREYGDLDELIDAFKGENGWLEDEFDYGDDDEDDENNDDY